MALENSDRNCYVFSDSLSALLFLKNFKISIKTNPYLFEVRKLIIDFQNKTKNNSEIKFFWVPAHVGLEGNETADKKAKEASCCTPLPSMKIPFTDLREHAKKIAMENTKTNLVAISHKKGTIFFLNYYDESTKPWFHNKDISRDIVSTINRCRANHYSLNDSLNRVGIIDKPDCECGHEKQSLDHILWQCPLFDNERVKFVANLKKSI